MDEGNDRHGYSQPTLAQYEALKTELDELRVREAVRYGQLADERDVLQGNADEANQKVDELRETVKTIHRLLRPYLSELPVEVAQAVEYGLEHVFGRGRDCG